MVKDEILIKKSEKAIVVLHEIYGVNNFIKDICEKISVNGYDVYSPLLIENKVFDYDDTENAYSNFINEAGFDCYKKVEELIIELKKEYKEVILLGFSVGATVAWRCAEKGLCSKVICFYGSRIRDYLEVNPSCQCLLIFAKYDSFDVEKVTNVLKKKENTGVKILEAKHGFMDKYGYNYNLVAARIAEKDVEEFLSSI